MSLKYEPASEPLLGIPDLTIHDVKPISDEKTTGQGKERLVRMAPINPIRAGPKTESRNPKPETRYRIYPRYRSTSLIRNSADLGPYSRVMLRALW